MLDPQLARTAVKRERAQEPVPDMCQYMLACVRIIREQNNATNRNDDK